MRHSSGHKTEVWDFDLIGEENFLVTGSTDNEIRLWELTHNAAYGERSDEENATEVSCSAGFAACM